MSDFDGMESVTLGRLAQEHQAMAKIKELAAKGGEMTKGHGTVATSLERMRKLFRQIERLASERGPQYGDD